MKCSEESPRSFRFRKSNMAGFADKTDFDELCTKCEQMELDVSKIDCTCETNVCMYVCDAHGLLFGSGTETTQNSQFKF